MRGNLGVYLQVSNRKQVRDDIKVIQTKFSKAAQSKGTLSCQTFTGRRERREDRKEGRRRDGGKKTRNRETGCKKEKKSEEGKLGMRK